MKYLLLWLALGALSACATAPTPYDTRYKRTEIAALSSTHFDIESEPVARALRPTYQKYGRPDLYIAGQMSSIDAPGHSRLYGAGQSYTKIALPQQAFWNIEGEALDGHLEPMKVVHLVYQTARLDDVPETLAQIGTLNHQGQTFTIFEREQDGLIVVSLHKTYDLPRDSTFESVRFFEN